MLRGACDIGLTKFPWFKGAWADNAVVKQIFTGWQLSGVTQAQAGQPFTILTGVDSNGNGGGGDRPNLNSSGALVVDPVTGNLRAFTNNNRFVAFLGSNNLPLQNGTGNGNLGKNTLRGPGFLNWDVSVSKRVRLFENRHSLLFRFDFFNAFNQDSYGNPVGNLSSSNFGKNLNNWGNRNMTLNLKYTF